MADKDADLQKIKALIEIMERNDLIEVEIKHGDDKIFIKRAHPQQPTIAAVSPGVRESRAVPPGPPARDISEAPGQISSAGHLTVESLQEEHLAEIKSPIVGTFYEAPSPDSEPYVEIGSQVSPQTVVCIVEAMKVMNEIKAETSGTIVEKFVATGQAVEFGQVLFKVRPD